MARVTKALAAKARHKKILKSTKGHYGARSRLFKTSKQSSIKGFNMLSGIERIEKEASDHYGFLE